MHELLYAVIISIMNDNETSKLTQELIKEIVKNPNNSDNYVKLASIYLYNKEY